MPAEINYSIPAISLEEYLPALLEWAFAQYKTGAYLDVNAGELHKPGLQELMVEIFDCWKLKNISKDFDLINEKGEKHKALTIKSFPYLHWRGRVIGYFYMKNGFLCFWFGRFSRLDDLRKLAIVFPEGPLTPEEIVHSQRQHYNESAGCDAIMTMLVHLVAKSNV